MRRCAISLPLAIIAMMAILAGFALYMMLAVRLYKRLRTAVQQRGYKSPVLLTGVGVAAFALPFVCTLLLAQLVGKDDNALWWLLLLFLAAPLGLTLRSADSCPLEIRGPPAGAWCGFRIDILAMFCWAVAQCFEVAGE